jgi:hypothetical protein
VYNMWLMRSMVHLVCRNTWSADIGRLSTSYVVR